MAIAYHFCLNILKEILFSRHHEDNLIVKPDEQNDLKSALDVCSGCDEICLLPSVMITIFCIITLVSNKIFPHFVQDVQDFPSCKFYFDFVN